MKNLRLVHSPVLRMRASVCLLAVVAFSAVGVLGSCAVKSRKTQAIKDGAESFKPVYSENLEFDFPPDPSKLLEAVYVIPGVSQADPEFVLAGVALDTQREVSERVFESPAIVSSQRADGLWDHKLLVRFRVTPENINGMKIKVTAKKVLHEGRPLEMETSFTLTEGSYLTLHKSPDSAAAGMAMLKEDAFADLRKEDATLANLMNKANRGEPGRTHAANSDLEAVAGAWVVETRAGGQTVYSQRAPAALVISNPGEAIIETNGFPLLLQGDNWGQVELRVGQCGRPLDNPICRGEQKGPVLTLLTRTPPKIAAQMITEFGVTLPAQSGPAGKSPDEEKIKALCEAQLSTFEEIPKERASCQNLSKNWNGKELALHLKLTSSDIADVELPHEQYRSLLGIKDTPESFVLTDGNGQPCTDVSCVFDFDRKELQTNPDGTPSLSEEFSRNLKAEAEAKAPEFATGKAVAERIDRHSGSFDFTTEAWQGQAGGWLNVWSQDDVRAWANSQCAGATEAQAKSWQSGTPMPQLALGRDALGVEPPPEKGEDIKEVNLSQLLKKWVISESKASTTITATGAQGDFALEVFVKDPQQDRVFDDASVRQIGQSLVIGGRALELLKPLTKRLETQGLPGGAGADTPVARVFANADVRNDILALTGQPGPRGPAFVKEDFQAGSLEPVVYYRSQDGKTEDRSAFLKNKDGQPCQKHELMQGECWFQYTGRAAQLTADNAVFRLSWGARPLLATFALPWRGYSSAQGTLQLPLGETRRVPNFGVILGLEEPTGGAGSGGVAGSGQAFQLTAAADATGPRGAGTRKSTPSAQATFWGLPEAHQGLASGGFMSKSFVKNYLVNPVAAVANEVVNKGKEYFEEISPIVREDLRAYFTQGYRNPNSGRHEIQAPLLKSQTTEKFDCANLPGFEPGKFATQIEIKPTFLNSRFDHLLRTDDSAGGDGIKRPLHLPTIKDTLLRKAEPVFASQNALFRNVRTHCDDETCYTDLDIVWKVNRKKKCYDFGTSCETLESEEFVYSRVVWFANQGEFVKTIKEDCQKEKKVQDNRLADFIGKLNTERIKPAMTGLRNLSPVALKDIQDLGAILSEKRFQEGLWRTEDVPQNLRWILVQDQLKALWVATENLKDNSQARRGLNEALQASGFNWKELSFDSVTEIELAQVKTNWPELPTDSQIRQVRKSLEAVLGAMRPKLTGLTCRVEASGFFKHFPDSRKHPAGRYDASEFPQVQRLTVGKALYAKANVRLQKDQVWNLSDTTPKQIQIARPDTKPLRESIVLTIPDTAQAGKQVQPVTALVPTCGNVGRVAVEQKIPFAKFMFQDPDCK